MPNQANERTKKLASIGKAVAVDKSIDHLDVVCWERDINSAHGEVIITNFAKACQGQVYLRRSASNAGMQEFRYSRDCAAHNPTPCLPPSEGYVLASEGRRLRGLIGC